MIKIRNEKIMIYFNNSSIKDYDEILKYFCEVIERY
jgi:hypothetical protein